MSTTNPPERYFQHFKGGLYRYITVAKDSETLENIVVYQALYGECGVWTRAEKSFFSQVAVNGTTVLRFRELSKEEFLNLNNTAVTA